jgi:hypothetical protein
MSHAMSACVLLAVFTYCSCMSKMLFGIVVAWWTPRVSIPLHNQTSMVKSSSKERRVCVSQSTALFPSRQAAQLLDRSLCLSISMPACLKQCSPYSRALRCSALPCSTSHSLDDYVSRHAFLGIPPEEHDIYQARSHSWQYQVFRAQILLLTFSKVMAIRPHEV